MIEIARHRALALLSECTGDDIWSVQHCRERRVPQRWIEELTDNYESGFQSNSQTIYVKNQLTNQYQGIRDVDLAMRIAQTLGLDVNRVTATASSRRHIVTAIKEAVMDGD
ncbi:hypothetical protein CA13_33700 [Planctomycetes bacterium CA13]|uniref:Uncharacterized protein n=1 Tax=Novipirellula herctigrandis TaxID=2527986 RepID=A0A5C5Z3Y0_9BACT|nr:hypothetical protein CA13_33700 [Planctomycetes bacterium CA13]